jgi:hypothetical protein
VGGVSLLHIEQDRRVEAEKYKLALLNEAEELNELRKRVDVFIYSSAGYALRKRDPKTWRLIVERSIVLKNHYEVLLPRLSLLLGSDF